MPARKTFMKATLRQINISQGKALVTVARSRASVNDIVEHDAKYLMNRARTNG
jgi:hypothetical protein